MIDLGYKVCLGDIPAQARDWRNHPGIRDWCRESDFITVEQQKKWLEKIQLSSTDRMYGIWAKLTDTKEVTTVIPVGVCGLIGIRQPHRVGEWSLYIAMEHQGKGYSIEALKCLLHHGFWGLGLQRIWGEIFETNQASIHLAEKLGFKKEGTLRRTFFKKGEGLDSFIYGLLKEEWKLNMQIGVNVHIIDREAGGI